MEQYLKILLVAINAKYIHSNLAVYCLRAYARNYAEHISLVEYTINHSEEDILKGIYKEQADVIAFSCYIWNMDMVTRIVTELKKVQPKAKIWFGGPEVTYDAKECLQVHEELDGVMIGEGEQTFLELMEYYVDKTKELRSIPGIAFREKARHDLQIPTDQEHCNRMENNDVIITTTIRQPILLDSVPFPYEDMGTFTNKIIYYESSRGCPFSCSYCLSSIDK